MRILAVARIELNQWQGEESHQIVNFLHCSAHQHPVDLVTTIGVLDSPLKSKTRKDLRTLPRSWQGKQQNLLHSILHFRHNLERM